MRENNDLERKIKYKKERLGNEHDFYQNRQFMNIWLMFPDNKCIGINVDCFPCILRLVHKLAHVI